jgi:hypothetical protein
VFLNESECTDGLDGDVREVIFQHFLTIFFQFVSQRIDPLNINSSLPFL